MSMITIIFEELRLIPGHALVAYGHSDIFWEYEPDDPSVGYRGGYSYTVEDIYIESDDPTAASKPICPTSELFKMIDEALHRSDWEDYIIDKIREDRENYF